MEFNVTVVGAGNVGAQCAYRLAQMETGRIILVDVVEGLPQGKALDMSQTGAVEGFNSAVTGTNDYADTRDSSVVVITAGRARTPGMSRDDLIHKNAEILKGVVEQVVKYSPQAILLIVTNPLDVMTHYALRISRFPPNRVLGMAPLLDAARMQYFLAQALKCSVKDVYAEVLGSHGDLMVPIPRLSTVKGKPLNEVLTAEQINNIVQRTKDGGAEIVALLKTGSAYYAPGSAAARMVLAMLADKKETIGTCCYLNGEYGLKEVYVGVPAKLGKDGVEEIVELELTKEEIEALHRSAQAVRELCANLPM